MSSWSFTQNHNKMHRQQNIRYCYCVWKLHICLCKKKEVWLVCSSVCYLDLESMFTYFPQECRGWQNSSYWPPVSTVLSSLQYLRVCTGIKSLNQHAGAIAKWYIYRAIAKWYIYRAIAKWYIYRAIAKWYIYSAIANWYIYSAIAKWYIYRQLQSDISTVQLQSDISTVPLQSDISTVQLQSDISTVQLQSDISTVKL